MLLLLPSPGPQKSLDPPLPLNTCLLTLPKVNPLAEDDKGNLIAADAKMGFDDNAAFRQKEIFAMKDDSQIDSRCVPKDVGGGAQIDSRCVLDVGGAYMSDGCTLLVPTPKGGHPLIHPY